jgi:hypothetical protein
MALSRHLSTSASCTSRLLLASTLYHQLSPRSFPPGLLKLSCSDPVSPCTNTPNKIASYASCAPDSPKPRGSSIPSSHGLLIVAVFIVRTVIIVLVIIHPSIHHQHQHSSISIPRLFPPAFASSIFILSFPIDLKLKCKPCIPLISHVFMLSFLPGLGVVVVCLFVVLFSHSVPLPSLCSRCMYT